MLKEKNVGTKSIGKNQKISYIEDFDVQNVRPECSEMIM